MPRGAAAPGDELPATLAARLLRWHARHGRHDLPWQGTRDPYRVWLSEVMLQQTQVATVIDYYGRFLHAFPDVQALAAATPDAVLARWSGLGYYSRARHLHRCAQVVVAQHGGRFPRTSAELATLPGIGRSTAAAIAAFCFGERVAILDGNVKRVLARVLAFDGDLARVADERRLWQLAERLVPARGVERYTQALMDLGATRCQVREPQCGRCPLAALCRAQAAGQQAAYPVRSRTLRRGRRQHVLLLLSRGDEVWLGRRPGRGVWAGLWSLPEFADHASLQRLAAGWPGRAAALPPIDHALTHFDWRLEPVRWTLPRRLSAARLQGVSAALGDGCWLAREEALRLGLPAPIRRLLEQVDS